MAAQNLASRLQKRIVAYSALGILATGVIVGLAGILPLAMQLRNAQTKGMQVDLRAQTEKAQDYINRARSAATLRGARGSQLRLDLAAHVQGLIDTAELQRRCGIWLAERLSFSSNTVGVCLVDGAGRLIAEAGIPVPPEHRHGPADLDAESALNGPLLIQGQYLLASWAPVLGDGTDRLGGVTVLYRLTALQKLVTDYSDLGKTGETIIGDLHNPVERIFFPYRPGRGSVGGDSKKIAAINKAISAAQAGESGILLPKDLDGVPLVLAYGPIKEVNWGMVIKINQDELFSRINQRIIGVAIVLCLLLLLGTAGMVILLRPMAGRVILHTDELESQIYEKTAALNTELGERLRAERSLRDSEALYHSLVDTLPISILRKDLKGRVTFGNRGYTEKMGRPLSELLGKTDFELFPRELAEKYSRNDTQVIETGKIFEDVEEHRSNDGARSYVHVLKAPVHDAAGKVVGTQVIFWDVTARRLAEEALEKTAADLERSNRELEQFAYVASHDLQEPLRMITSYTQLIARRYGEKLDSDAREFMQFAVNGALRMQRLIQDLLAYSRVGTRGKSFELVDMGEVLSAALENLRIAIEESGATIQHDPLPVVMADGIQLLQLLQNLVGNAIKFRGNQPPFIRVTCQQRKATSCPVGETFEKNWSASGEEWVVRVQDNGMGIEPQFFEKIFAIFQRLHSHDRYPGTGIGLAICKKIVERHGGRIWVESTPGEGSMFCFTLPVLHERLPIPVAAPVQPAEPVHVE